MTDVKEEMPDISQWYTEEDVKEYYLYGITREMLQEASIDSSEYESKLDPNMIGKTTADPEFFCKVRILNWFLGSQNSELILFIDVPYHLHILF